MSIVRSRPVEKLAQVSSRRVVYGLDDLQKRWRLGRQWPRANADRAAAFEAHRPELTETQRTVLDRLATDGYCQRPAADLLPRQLVDDLVADGSAWADLMADPEGEGAPTGPRSHAKPYEVKRFPAPGTVVPLDTPALRMMLDPGLLDLAAAYFELDPLIYHVDTWSTQASEGDRIQSQVWHRDPDDLRILKVFFYVKPVAEAQGPMQFVAGSQNGGAHDQVVPQRPPWGARISDPADEAQLAGLSIRTAVGDAGTIVLVDTTGLHRGGYARQPGRLLQHGIYVTGGTLRQRSFAPPADPTALSGMSIRQRHALIR